MKWLGDQSLGGLKWVTAFPGLRCKSKAERNLSSLLVGWVIWLPISSWQTGESRVRVFTSSERVKVDGELGVSGGSCEGMLVCPVLLGHWWINSSATDACSALGIQGWLILFSVSASPGVCTSVILLLLFSCEFLRYRMWSVWVKLLLFHVYYVNHGTWQSPATAPHQIHTETLLKRINPLISRLMAGKAAAGCTARSIQHTTQDCKEN